MLRLGGGQHPIRGLRSSKDCATSLSVRHEPLSENQPHSIDPTALDLPVCCATNSTMASARRCAPTGASRRGCLSLVELRLSGALRGLRSAYAMPRGYRQLGHTFVARRGPLEAVIDRAQLAAHRAAKGCLAESSAVGCLADIDAALPLRAIKACF